MLGPTASSTSAEGRESHEACPRTRGVTGVEMVTYTAAAGLCKTLQETSLPRSEAQ